MLARFLAWHAADGRELIGVEVEFDATVGRALHPREGRPAGARRRGPAGGRRPQDRQDPGQEHRGARAAGRLPGGRRGGRVRRARHRAGRRGAAAGRHGSQGKEQHQEPLPADVPLAETWAGELLAEVGEGMGAATFEVRTGSHCQRCPARRSCPLQEPGRQVTG